jgi:oxygen-independent coproporphyrinogen-3 oxidase
VGQNPAPRCAPIPAAALYVHIPFCKAKCGYCDFFSVPLSSGAAVPDEYVAAVCGDIARQRENLRAVETLYLGGGTPSLLSPRQLRRIVAAVRTQCGLADGAEITLEANPADITGGFLSAAADAGVNRLSVGVQSFSREALRAAHRTLQNGMTPDTLSAGTPNALDSLFGTLSRYWRGTVSADLIAGLPGETAASFRGGLTRLIGARPHHISLYALTFEDGTPLCRAVRSGVVRFSEEEADDMWLAGRDMLEAAGYGQYEVSNFALAGYECRHNQTYWRLDSYAGAGAGAVGTVFFANGTGLRHTRPADVAAYIRSAGGAAGDDERLGFGTALFECLMLGFRTREGVSARAFTERFGVPLAERIGADGGAFMRWEREGRAEQDGDRYRLTREGLLFLNRFLAELA